jgi:hypothetical protein
MLCLCLLLLPFFSVPSIYGHLGKLLQFVVLLIFYNLLLLLSLASSCLMKMIKYKRVEYTVIYYHVCDSKYGEGWIHNFNINLPGMKAIVEVYVSHLCSYVYIYIYYEQSYIPSHVVSHQDMMYMQTFQDFHICTLFRS